MDERNPPKTEYDTETSPFKKDLKRNQILLGGFLVVLGFALFISFVSFFLNWQSDQTVIDDFFDRKAETQNGLKKFGAWISHVFVYNGFGLASFIFTYLIAITGYVLFFGKPQKKLADHWLWGCFTAIWIATTLGFTSNESSVLGGVIGFEINDFLQDYVGKIGTVLILLLGLILYLVSRLNVNPQAVAFGVRRLFLRVLESDTPKPEDLSSEGSVPHSNTNTDEDGLQKTKNTTAEIAKKEDEFSPTESELQADDVALKVIVRPANDETDDTPNFHITPLAENDGFAPSNATENSEEEGSTTEQENSLSLRLLQLYGPYDPKLELSTYKFPTVDFLEEHGKSTIVIDEAELQENKNIIVSTLRNYKIDISEIRAAVGPTVTLYEIIPAAGIRISKIKSLEDDIALSLSALGIRIIAPMPGKGTIGIEVPNKKPTVVSMKSVITSERFTRADMELPLVLGKTISNETFVVDLTKMPHLLMAGATGQGKSVGLNAVLTSILYKKHPSEVKFVLVDPKKVELTLFNKIERHFLAKLPGNSEAIITDNTKVIHTLNSLCIEMDSRYELLKNAAVRNIKEYNTKFKNRRLNPDEGHRFLPYIVLIVDEFADLIMTAGKEVEMPIARLAQLARAIGIHLIVATQRPSVNVITGIIKANFPARIAFRVTSKIDSRTILDSTGAEQLIGRGDMLFTQGNDLTRIQCAFVDTPEVEKIADYISSQRAFPEAYLLPEYEGEESSAKDIDVSERDSLFKEAAEVIVTSQQGSASLLQRKLKLGYNRAGRLIDQMEAAGIVGPFEGSKSRKVLISDLNSLNQILNPSKNE